MQLHILTPAEIDAAIAEDLAERMRTTVKERGKVVVTLPFGRTPARLYALWRADRSFDWSRVVLINGDEYLGVGVDDAGSGGAYLMENLLGPLLRERDSELRLRSEHVRLLDGTAEPGVEAQAHEAFVRAHGGVDIALLGVGEGPRWAVYRMFLWLRRLPGGPALLADLSSRVSSPHLWFNERHTSFTSRTRVVVLTSASRRANGTPHQRALTFGLQNIAESRQTVVLVKGKRKRSVLDLLVRGPVTEKIPASFLRRRDVAENVTIYADTEAAGEGGAWRTTIAMCAEGLDP